MPYGAGVQKEKTDKKKLTFGDRIAGKKPSAAQPRMTPDLRQKQQQFDEREGAAWMNDPAVGRRAKDSI